MKHTTDEPIKVGTTSVSINPGSGDVKEGNEKNAIDNIKHFITDLGNKKIKFVRVPKEDDGGRFAFLIYDYSWGKTNVCLILMPGLFLSDVRYIANENQNIWDFPRLYVDGSSFVWKYALGVCFKKEDE